jgi:hypothetical protein
MQGDSVSECSRPKSAGDGTEEAVTYRRDPCTGHVLHGVHSSAEAACRRFSSVLPLVLLQEDETPSRRRFCHNPRP